MLARDCIACPYESKAQLHKPSAPSRLREKLNTHSKL